MPEKLLPPVRIAVCDGVEEDRDRTFAMAHEILKSEGVFCTFFVYDEAELLAEVCKEEEEFQCLLLGVSEEEGTGLAATLRDKGFDGAIVLLSRSAALAPLGYEVEAARYLLKPLQREKLREALLFCLHAGLREILLPIAGGRRRVALSELMFVETYERGVRLSLTSGECRSSVKISALAAALPERQFVFVHRTLLVNLAFVQFLRYRELTLKTGKVLPVSKYRQADVKARLQRWLRNNAASSGVISVS